MEQYIELAAACLGLPLSASEETVQEKLEDRWGVDIADFSEIADTLLTKTKPFPSPLIEGELVQAFVRPSNDGKALQAFIRRIIPPGQDWTDERAGQR